MGETLGRLWEHLGRLGEALDSFGETLGELLASTRPLGVHGVMGCVSVFAAALKILWGVLFSCEGMTSGGFCVFEEYVGICLKEQTNPCTETRSPNEILSHNLVP